MAAEELQQHLRTQTNWTHNFGLDDQQAGLVIGKMFGVLVVENPTGQLGYLAAFSGKLADANHHPKFVPPVFDMLTNDGFFKKEEAILNDLNRQIEALENDPTFLEATTQLEQEKALRNLRLTEQKAKMKAAKKARKAQRTEALPQLSEVAYKELTEKLRQESIKSHFYLKDLQKYWQERLARSEAKVAVFNHEIATLKAERKAKSNALQSWLFQQYQFLNAHGETKHLLDVFTKTTPPAGAGECAAPKLLQYAFQHQLRPVCMAEFWWGQSPKSEIRRHGQFYPACRSKCEPILGHMLQGLSVDDNPLLVNPAVGKALPIIYEDDYLLVVNKPSEMLSVPGKNVQDSVYTRIKAQYPKATGPLIVHRLDMSTSGLLILAKDKETHRYLQYQFIKKTVQKRYVALLNGLVEKDEGIIDLPLRVDLDNRPQQLVCYDYGKPAMTKWKVIERTNGRTLIHFFPVTGRTHQLRVHSAHPLGLNTPIVGDDLYGTRDKRLHLHAAWISFRHPKSRELLEFEVTADF